MAGLLILVTGDPPPAVAEQHGGFDVMVRRTIAEAWRGRVTTADARGTLPDASGVAGVIVTGSPASVHHRDPWMLATEAWLRDVVARGTPVFGICFGHQILAQALGGQVLPNPRGQERGTLPVATTGGDPLLAGNGGSFQANLWHDDTVVRPPEGAVRLARSVGDACQLLRLAPRVYGAQFHPEFDGAVLRSYVAARAPELAAAGHDAASLARNAADTPEGAAVLRRWTAMAADPGGAP